MKECPKCLGFKEIYNYQEDNMIVCSLCKGNGKVRKEIASTYDALLDDLKFIENETDEV